MDRKPSNSDKVLKETQSTDTNQKDHPPASPFLHPLLDSSEKGHCMPAPDASICKYVSYTDLTAQLNTTSNAQSINANIRQTDISEFTSLVTQLVVQTLR